MYPRSSETDQESTTSALRPGSHYPPVLNVLREMFQRGSDLLMSIIPTQNNDYIHNNVVRTKGINDPYVSRATSLRGRRLGYYFLQQPIGSGGYGNVYLALNTHLNANVAIKILKPSAASPDEVQRFEFEMSLHNRMRHRFIVPLFDAGWVRDMPFLVMPYASEGTLEQRFSPGIAHSLQTILPVVEQIASALQYMHDRNMIHCDVKPGNMLMGPRREVWLCDFGSAMIASPVSQSGGREVRGSLTYAAPEQINHLPHCASDQYALAVMVYQWLCGVRPFRGTDLEICQQHMSTPPPPLRGYVPDLPRAVEDVVLQALAKDPSQRFAQIQDFAVALAQANPVPESPVVEPTPAPARPRRTIMTHLRLLCR